MNKREISAVMSASSAEEVREIAEKLRERCKIEILKQPQKTLVMVKVRECVGQSLFYLGEMLATECMVTVDGNKGASVIAGDHFDKALNAAIIDGYLNGQDERKQEVLEEIKTLQERRKKEREKLNRQLRKSKVNFNVMGE